jgi:exopolyphosphatase/guanosine-5'-triphosphate,3'-diphosphate pyrophosphatase
MSSQKRFWLQCGALLHDIGWTEGQQRHHKTALRLIMGAAELPLERREREIVALIARYHRKALPRDDHKYYANLTRADKQTVRVLAGILRIADGLDRTHGALVQSVHCAVSERRIHIEARAPSSAHAEVAAAQRKANLLEDVWGRPVTIETRRPA